MKIEYKAIDKSDNVYKGVETVKDVEDLCRRLATRNLMPIAIRMLGSHSVETFSQIKHLKNLKKKLEHKIDQEIDIDNIPVPTPILSPKKRNRVDPIYILYFFIVAALAVGYYMGL